MPGGLNAAETEKDPCHDIHQRENVEPELLERAVKDASGWNGSVFRIEMSILPKRNRGGQSRKAIEKYERDLTSFCNQIKQIKSTFN